MAKDVAIVTGGCMYCCVWFLAYCLESSLVLQEYCRTEWRVLKDRFEKNLYPYADSFRLK